MRNDLLHGLERTIPCGIVFDATRIEHEEDFRLPALPTNFEAVNCTTTAYEIPENAELIPQRFWVNFLVANQDVAWLSVIRIPDGRRL